MKKPSFKVVTNVVILLTFLGILTEVLRPFIPKHSTNKLDRSREGFLRQAAYHDIRWLANSPAAFAQARREGKPILFVVGVSWNEIARRMDNRVFNDPDVARYLTRNYICVRVDAAEDRKWLNAYLPYSRIPLAFQSGFQIWILDSRGRMLDLLGSNYTNDVDPDTFIEALAGANNLVDRIEQKQETPIQPDEAQREDLQYLRISPTAESPDFEAYNDSLDAMVDTQYGGFPENQVQTIMPNAFRYLLLTGRYNALRAALDPVAFSNLYDLMDGGFFRRGYLSDRRTVTYDKPAGVNSEMALLLAMAASQYNDPAYRILARDTFDFVAEGLTEDGLISSARIGVSLPNGRSLRHSVGLAKLRRFFSREDVAWAEDHLSLRPRDNPQMVPHLKDRKTIVVDWPRTQRIMRRLQRESSPGPIGTKDSAEAHCHSTARLLQAARLWNNANRLQKALDLAKNGERFYTTRGILPRTDALSESDYLGDWLAYADMALQHYVLTGDASMLSKGRKILAEAVSRFQGTVPGEYLVARTPSQAAVPEVADNFQESCTARVIRLCSSYGILLRGTALGAEFREKARLAISRYATALADSHPLAAGYFCSALLGNDPVAALVVGSEAVLVANELSHRVPTLLVAPATHQMAANLKMSSPGIYILQTDSVIGPIEIPEAVHRLRSRALERLNAP